MNLQLLKPFAVVAISTALFACQKTVADTQPSVSESMLAPASAANQSQKSNTFYGPQVSMGNGKARSFVTISHTDAPSEIGIEMTNDAFTGLPTTEEGASFVLPLHQKAQAVTPFDHIEIDWNPNGHPPTPYLVPHFDFHFYKISMAEQQAIVPGPLMEILPPSGAMPPTYIPTPGGVPQMGKHWVDVTSPELNGKPFTKTFIYGSYNGKVIFDEPMITLATLLSGQSSSTPIPQPQIFMPANTYYPTTYNISADDKKHYVSLSNFVFRP